MKKILLVSLIAFVSVLSNYCEAQPDISFDSLSTGMTSPGAYVLSLAIKDSNGTNAVYAGGHFTIAGRNTAINIAEWICTNYSWDENDGYWAPLGKGIDSDVCALAVFNNHLYAGGKFDSAGGIAASHIATWDTAAHKWDSLLGTLNGNVYALCIYNNALYVGGNFTIVNGDTVDRIAEWKNNTWFPVGKGFDTGAVYALTVSNDTLYAGGSFLKSNGKVLNHIAKLSGANWASVGIGTNNTVYALNSMYGELYIGGAFTKTGGITSRYFSSYNYFNLQWEAMDGIVNDTVRALGNAYFPHILMAIKKLVGGGFGDALMIGGNFDSAYGTPDKYLTLYDGYYGIDSLSHLAGTGPVYAIASSNSWSNYFGGIFSTATYYFPFSTEALNNVSVLGFHNLSGGIQNINDKSDVNIYPNPSGGMFTIVIASEAWQSQNNIQVYNMIGESVLTETLRSAQGDNIINLGNQPNGIYLYRVIDENSNLIGEGKLVIER